MKLNVENKEVTIVINSLSNYIEKLDSELKELSTYRTELDNPIIIQAVALEQKRISNVKDDSSNLLNNMQKHYGKLINV
jgi:hypothetical protein